VRNAGIIGLLELKTLNCAPNAKQHIGTKTENQKQRHKRIENRIRVIGSRPSTAKTPIDPPRKEIT